MSKMVYSWRSPLPYCNKVKAQAVGEHLSRLRRSKRLTPKVLVTDARQRSSPMHCFFEWKDSKAAELYREHQARNLIGNLVAVIAAADGKSTYVRAFVNVTENKESHYETVQAALRDEHLRKQVLADALGELNSWRVRYQELNELARIFSALDATQRQLELEAS